MEMETESESEEDGQITKYDELEERRNSNSKGTNGTVVEDDTPITLDDLNSVRLPRDLLAKHCMAPWFEEYVKGWYPCCYSFIKPMFLMAKSPSSVLFRCMGSLPHWECRRCPDLSNM